MAGLVIALLAIVICVVIDIKEKEFLRSGIAFLVAIVFLPFWALDVGTPYEGRNPITYEIQRFPENEGFATLNGYGKVNDDGTLTFIVKQDDELVTYKTRRGDNLDYTVNPEISSAVVTVSRRGKDVNFWTFNSWSINCYMFSIPGEKTANIFEFEHE